MQTKRVVVTGMGVIAPNGKNLIDFLHSLQNGISGIKFHEQLSDIGMRCCVAGIPTCEDQLLKLYADSNFINRITCINVKYACIAAIEAWVDAGLTINEIEDIDTGCIIGCSTGDIQQIKGIIELVDSKQLSKLGTRAIEQLMGSGASAKVAGLLGLGNWISSNSSACATGTESVLLAYERIARGDSMRMVAGSCESPDKYIWSNFDNMRLLSSKYNSNPEEACRPLSSSASGFVPGAGSGILILEELETAQKRGAKIYAEIVGGHSNSGGQRREGTMTAPNKNAVINCIVRTLEKSNIQAQEVGLISGHLTATMGDALEAESWSVALNRKQKNFPKINSTKSMIGHCLSAAGSIEIISVILQIYNEFIHENLNCPEVHPNVLKYVDADCIPIKKENTKINLALKGNFGFGDVNSIIAIKKYCS